ncbi:unnamed protein product [Moneuplotes crassus]|uniref:Uncharacterized protein n=1 Tax=Euplotes crassus TaxID=5936 RepID=A0AAD1Y0I1_EUPCR|nr:unnamed protein product [Moneuplotes crassus]
MSKKMSDINLIKQNNTSRLLTPVMRTISEDTLRLSKVKTEEHASHFDIAPPPTQTRDTFSPKNQGLYSLMGNSRNISSVKPKTSILQRRTKNKTLQKMIQRLRKNDCRSLSPVLSARDSIRTRNIPEKSDISSKTQTANNRITQQLKKLSNLNLAKKAEDTSANKVILEAKEEILYLITKVHKVVMNNHDNPVFDSEGKKLPGVQPGMVNIINIGPLQVQYFRIDTLHQEAPLTVKIVEDEKSKRRMQNDNFIKIYLSYSKEYPDSKNNDGVFQTGKILITTPSGDGRFSFECCSFAILSSIDCQLKIAYYFKNSSPIAIMNNSGPKTDYVLNSGDIDVLSRMNTQIVHTDRIETEKFQYANKTKKIQLKIEQIVSNKEYYKRFIKETQDILSNRFKRFLKAKRTNNSRATKMREYLNTIPEGVGINEFRQQSCRSRREVIKNFDRKKNIFYLDRWEYLNKLKKERVEDARIKMQKHDLIKQYLTLYSIYNFINTVKDKMVRKKAQKISIVIGEMASMKMQFNFKSFCMKKGVSIHKRMQVLVRHSICSAILLKRSGTEYKARKILHQFLVARKVRSMFRYRCISYAEKKKLLPLKLMEIIKVSRIRRKKLQHMWEDQRSKIIYAYRNLKKKNKRIRETLKRLKHLNPHLRNKCLQMYLRTCGVEHSIAFFKWRDIDSPDADYCVKESSKKLVKCIKAEQKYFSFEDQRKMNDSIMVIEITEENTDAQNNDIMNEINENTPGMGDTTSFNEKKEPDKSLKLRSIFEQMDMDYIVDEEEYEIDDLNIVGITFPKSTNSKPTKKKRKLNFKQAVKFVIKRTNYRKKSCQRLQKIENDNPRHKSFFTTINRKLMRVEGSEDMDPPEFLYIPSRTLMRYMILRACYIQDPDQFMKDTTLLTLEEF